MSNEATKKRYYSCNSSQYTSLAVIKRLVGKNKTVLDVGCASGYLGEMLMEEGNVLYGIDGNADAVEQARSRKYVDVRHIDLNNIPHTVFDMKFDVIVFADVLEHLVDPESVLSYFMAFLKPGGKVIVSLPNVALWRVRLNLLLGKFDYTDYGVLDRTHLHLYTFKSAKRFVRNAGYREKRTTHAVNLSLLGILMDLIPFLRSLFSIHVIMEAVPESALVSDEI